MTKLFKPCRQKGEKGFTLIELLIVIAVLGILAAVAIPNVSSFITSGKVAAANSELASVNTASQAYQADNNGDVPTSAGPGTDGNLASYLQNPLQGSYDFEIVSGADYYGQVTNGSYPGISGWEAPNESLGYRFTKE